MTGETAEAAAARPLPAAKRRPEHIIVSVRVKEARQLFSSLDPSPFHERDLDPAAADYIVSWVRQEPTHAEITIQIVTPEAELENAQRFAIDEAVANYFSARESDAKRELKELFAMGRRYLAVGVCILLLCLTASHGLRELPGDAPWKLALQEGLFILGWVANWKPIETFLYDWQPIVRRRNLYRRLARAKVEFVAA